MNENGSKQAQQVIENDDYDFKNHKSEMVFENSNVYSWDDIHASAVAYEQFTEAALREIYYQLGYLPKRQSTLPDEPFIRHCMAEYVIHGDQDKLWNDCNPHVLNIWHRDMKPHTVEKYPQHIYNAYENFLPEFKDAARARLIKFLKQEPQIEHSVYAELLLRKKTADESVYLGDEATAYDLEAMTITEYRRDFIKAAKAA